MSLTNSFKICVLYLHIAQNIKVNNNGRLGVCFIFTLFCQIRIQIWYYFETPPLFKEADTKFKKIQHNTFDVREGPLICALFAIRTMFKLRWMGGLESRGRSNCRMRKKSAGPTNKYSSPEIQQNPFRN